MGTNVPVFSLISLLMSVYFCVNRDALVPFSVIIRSNLFTMISSFTTHCVGVVVACEDSLILGIRWWLFLFSTVSDPDDSHALIPEANGGSLLLVHLVGIDQLL